MDGGGETEKGVSLKHISPDWQMVSDTSRKNWGATFGHQQVTGTWSEKEKKEHINVLELRVRLVEELILWAEEKEITLIPKFIEGKKNTVADTLSRKGQIVTTEWTLNIQVCQSLWKTGGCPLVDLFATVLTKRLPNYFSPHLDPSAIGIDALLQDSSHLDRYAFPHYAIIRKVINKLRESENRRRTLIAPWWPQREWFPDLRDLLVDSPRALPLRRDLLLQPMARALHTGLSTLHLTAWRLSSNWPERRDYQKKSQRELLEQRPPPLTPDAN